MIESVFDIVKPGQIFRLNEYRYLIHAVMTNHYHVFIIYDDDTVHYSAKFEEFQDAVDYVFTNCQK